MLAIKPIAVTDEVPLATFNGALVETAPTSTVNVVSTSAPVLL